MLNNHAQTFRLKSVAVKTASTLALLIVATPMMAQAADFTKTRYKVRFDRSLVQTESGIEKVYSMLEKKAEKACKSGTTVKNGERITKDACIADLLDQFVESADIAPVKAYHAAKLTDAT